MERGAGRGRVPFSVARIGNGRVIDSVDEKPCPRSGNALASRLLGAGDLEPGPHHVPAEKEIAAGESTPSGSRAIHDEQGYRDLRRRLARHYDVATQDPDLQITDADLSGSRRLVLTHHVRNGVLLEKAEAERTLQYLAQLWGYRVKLVETEDSRVLREHEALPMP